jgi:tripartite-type tricarboxylate transporter receptor subunit TctC
MKKARREFLRLAASASAISVLSGIALAQKYPARPVRLVVGYAAGGAADTLARIVGLALTERLGQTFVVENRVGAGGDLATEMILRTPADGYTMLVNTTPNIASAPLANDFDLSRDTAPVGGISRGYLARIRRCQRKISPSSLPTPRRTLAKSRCRRRAMARLLIWPASFSK